MRGGLQDKKFQEFNYSLLPPMQNTELSHASLYPNAELPQLYRTIREEEHSYLKALKKAIDSKDDTTLAQLKNPSTSLINPFEHFSEFVNEEETPEEKEIPKILDLIKKRLHLPVGEPSIVSREVFNERWEQLTVGLLKGTNLRICHLYFTLILSLSLFPNHFVYRNELGERVLCRWLGIGITC